MSKQLFDGFSAVSAEEWREKIIKDLKGKPFESLLKDNFEGIAIKPDYTEADIEHNNGVPGEFPFSRGTKKENNNWAINQCFGSENENTTNTKLLDALNRGITAFTLKNVNRSSNLKVLLNEVLPQYIETYFDPTSNWEAISETFVALAKQHSWPLADIKGGMLYDPIGKVITTGDWYTSENDDLNRLTALTNATQSLSAFKTVAVNGQHYHNAGATATQELGFALAHAHEYLVQLLEGGKSIDEAASSIWMSLASGTQYFMDIAKLRAARILWAKIVEQYQPKDEASAQLHLHVESSNWYNAIYDPHTNMLRATSSAMAGAIGGCDSMTVLPFDNAYKASDEFSDRIARNVQLILQEESYLDKIVDPSAGSYYIEYLTDQVAAKAWDVFKAVETKGGMLAAIKEGYVQQEIAAMAAQKDEKVASGELVILGVNKYPNQQETMKDKVDANWIADKENGTAITPIRLYRAAATIENERLAAE